MIIPRPTADVIVHALHFDVYFGKVNVAVIEGDVHVFVLLLHSNRTGKQSEFLRPHLGVVYATTGPDNHVVALLLEPSEDGDVVVVRHVLRQSVGYGWKDECVVDVEGDDHISTSYDSQYSSSVRRSPHRRTYQHSNTMTCDQ
jgi:hypothetical protein